MYFQYYNKNVDRRVRLLKLLAAIFLGLGLIIASTFASWYSQLYFQAINYNESKEVATGEVVVDKIDYYDLCQSTETLALDIDTRWTFMYRVNMMVYAMLSGMLFCSFGGLIYSKLLQATLSCLQIAGAAHLFALLLIGVLRFNSSGLTCATKDVVYDTEGHSWESDAATVKALFIAQCTLFIPFCACTCIGYFKQSPPKAASLDAAMYEDDEDDAFQRPHY